MVKGIGSEKENTDKAQVLQQLMKLAETAELYEIRRAAYYIASNVSERTTKTALREFKEELSKLLDSVRDQEETNSFEQAISELLLILPDRVPRQVKPSLLHRYFAEPLLAYNSSGSDSANLSPAREDESVPLLGDASTRPWYGCLRMRK